MSDFAIIFKFTSRFYKRLISLKQKTPMAHHGSFKKYDITAPAKKLQPTTTTIWRKPVLNAADVNQKL